MKPLPICELFSLVQNISSPYVIQYLTIPLGTMSGRLWHLVTTDCCFDGCGWCCIPGQLSLEWILLQCHLCFPPQQFFLCRAAASVVQSMRFLPFCQCTAAKTGQWIFICILRALFVEITASTPQTTEGLFAVSPDMAKLKAVVTWHKTCMGMAWLNLDTNMTEAS